MGWWMLFQKIRRIVSGGRRSGRKRRVVMRNSGILGVYELFNI